MSLGGFNGSDPYPTLAEFEALVGAGRVHYFIAGGTGGSGGAAANNSAAGADSAAGTNATAGSSAAAQTAGNGSSMSAISAWVAAHFTSQTVGGITVYDLTSRSS